MDIRGFRVNFLGDSITEGIGVADRAHCRYDNRLKVACGLSRVKGNAKKCSQTSVQMALDYSPSDGV